MHSIEVVPSDGAPLPVRATSGVPIENRLHGFCAFRWLREGDVVLAMTTPLVRRFQSWDDLSRTVRMHGAGVTVTFEVLRQGRVLEIPIRLDARPADADTTWQDKTHRQRAGAAEAYWMEHFSTLVENRVSSSGG